MKTTDTGSVWKVSTFTLAIIEIRGVVKRTKHTYTRLAPPLGIQRVSRSTRWWWAFDTRGEATKFALATQADRVRIAESRLNAERSVLRELERRLGKKAPRCPDTETLT